MIVYIVWCHDDGILGVFQDYSDAAGMITKYHNEGYYHKEDLMIDDWKVI